MAFVTLFINGKRGDNTLKGTNIIARDSLFWSRKVFDGVHFHVMDLLRKSDFDSDWKEKSGPKSEF